MITQPEFTVVPEVQSPNHTRFILEPLPQGYGQTLGNSLRRVLYNSIPGAAIVSVHIDGATHQFTTLAGVKEDIVGLVLNLKQIRLQYTGTKSTKMTLSATGPGPITASEFNCPPDVKIANPDLVIANLSDKKSELNLECEIEAGFGYSPAEDRKSNTVGLIMLDAVFSPVTRVNYSIEATRVGRLTNYDKLILEVITDGTITPQAALDSATNTLVNYFSAIIHPTTSAAVAPSTTGTQTNSTNASVSVEELDLPTRISNALIKAGLDTVNDLLSIPKAELAKIKNLGTKSVKIIELALHERGFDLAAWYMHHNIFGKQLSRDTGQRLALIRGLAGAIIRSESIETTQSKAEAAEGLIEKLITFAKRGHLPDIRQIESVIPNKDLVSKLVHEIAPRYANQAGGYLRLVKTGTRTGDNAPMVRMEFVTPKAAPAPVVKPAKSSKPVKKAPKKTSK